MRECTLGEDKDDLDNKGWGGKKGDREERDGRMTVREEWQGKRKGKGNESERRLLNRKERKGK